MEKGSGSKTSARLSRQPDVMRDCNLAQCEYACWRTGHARDMHVMHGGGAGGPLRRLFCIFYGLFLWCEHATSMFATCTCQACCEQSGSVSHAWIGAVQVEIFGIMFIFKTCAFVRWLAWILGSKVVRRDRSADTLCKYTW